MGNLLDVVHQGEELPLGIDLALAAQREPPHPLVLEVGEHRLDDGDALVISVAPQRGVELAFHLLDRAFFPGLGLADEERDLLGVGGLGGRQASASQGTGTADGLGAAELHPEVAVDVDVVAVAVKIIAGRAAAGAVGGVVVEVFRREALGVTVGAAALFLS